MTTTLPTSFSSLPEDIVLNCLARVSKFHRPTLSLVSKYFRSLIASPDLEATRSRNEIKEEHLCVCFDVHADPRWFTLLPFPTQQKLKPIPSPYKHPRFSTVLSIGSEIYIIGGLVEYGKKGNRVLVLDCESHQLRRLPNMRLCRKSPAADVIDGKIYVIGGSNSHKIKNWGEVYDPETKIWEPLLPTTVLDLTTRKSVVPGKLVMGGKVYDMYGLEFKLNTKVCLVEIETLMYQISISDGMLVWCDLEESLELSRKVEGLEGVARDSYFTSYLTCVASYDRGRRVTVWWKLTCGNWAFDECKTEIWCAEISFERRDLGRLWGFVEWSKNVCIFDQYKLYPDLFLHYAIVTY
ncbi:PREDICTED: putative F-box/kelch-repeat protein At3g46050 [Camelina sativa]|uniref:F-box/kelch-repeat protein At3g46050 n=1 Tax=Camelina sativa TaxID=90675 RepID=A0ABM0W8R4_CAMSA|nr:PREDICTED: putative F-box/kelch-repeat protein At3g46050 [Camelina sativa]